MPSLARSILIDVPPARVYEAYTHFASWWRWVPHFQEVTPLDGAVVAPGFRARIRETYSLLPAVWRVTHVDGGRSFAWTNSPVPGLRLTVDHVTEPAGAGARATLRIDVEGPLGLLASPVALRLSRRTFDRSLVALKAMLEG